MDDEKDIVARLRALASEFPTIERWMDNEWTNAADEIERLRGERDAARAEVCLMRPSVCLGAQSAQQYAESRGWNCFKEES